MQAFPKEFQFPSSGLPGRPDVMGAPSPTFVIVCRCCDYLCCSPFGFLQMNSEPTDAKILPAGSGDSGESDSDSDASPPGSGSFPRARSGKGLKTSRSDRDEDDDPTMQRTGKRSRKNHWERERRERIAEGFDGLRDVLRTLGIEASSKLEILEKSRTCLLRLADSLNARPSVASSQSQPPPQPSPPQPSHSQARPASLLLFSLVIGAYFMSLACGPYSSLAS